MFLTMPVLPYTFSEMRRLSRRVTRAATGMDISGHQVRVHDLHPAWVQPGWSIGTHTHSFYEAHLMLEGQAEYTIGGSQPLVPGQVVLHAPHVVHSWRVPAEAPSGCKVLVIWLTIDPPVALTTPDTWPCWPELVWDVALLLHEAEGDVPGKRLRLHQRTATLVSRLLSLAEFPPEPVDAPCSAVELVADIDKFLLDNLARPLRLSDVAAHISMSERHLIRRFREWTGDTLWERLDCLRMRRAAQLLTETTLSVAHIGGEVGMPDASYFTRRFRRHFRTSPQRYREEMRRIVT